MSERPRRATANTKPAQIIIDNTQKRRSSAQVQADAVNAAIVKTTKEAADARQKAEKIARIAAAEDRLRQEDDIARKHAERPDLLVAGKKVTKKPVPAKKVQVPESEPSDDEVVKGSAVEQASGKFMPATNWKGRAPESELSDDEVAEGDTAKPELVMKKVPARRAPVHENEPSDSEADTTMLFEGDVDIPDDSIVDTESSDGRGLDEFDASDQEDNDYVSKPQDDSSEDADSETDFIVKKPTKKDKKIKPKRGDLRQTINSVRQVAPASGIKVLSVKRKEPTDTKPLTQSGKRAKKNEPSGLLADWKKKVGQKGFNKSATDLVKNELDDIEGEFHEDEGANSIMAARAAKGGNIIKVRYEAPMSIIETPSVDIEEFQQGRGLKKEKYGVNDLPFPSGPGKAAYHQKWRRQFKHSLWHWAGTIPDPFGTNAIMGPKVREIWNAVYPSLVLENNDPAWDIIRCVAGSVLIDWRSTAGKDAIKIVVKAFKENKVPNEELCEVAKYYLKGFRYIYGNPDAADPEKEAFLGPFVLEMFATHLKKTTASVGGYGHPVGGLAMAVAALERAFELIKEGLVTLDDEDGADKKKLPQFNDKLWGNKVRGWVVSTRKLDVKIHWPPILQATASRVLGMDEGDDDDAEADPRAMIVICPLQDRRYLMKDWDHRLELGMGLRRLPWPPSVEKSCASLKFVGQDWEDPVSRISFRFRLSAFLRNLDLCECPSYPKLRFASTFAQSFGVVSFSYWLSFPKLSFKPSIISSSYSKSSSSESPASLTSTSEGVYSSSSDSLIEFSTPPSYPHSSLSSSMKIGPTGKESS